MSQKRIKVGTIDRFQPDKFDYSFATTFTQDSGRPQGGTARLTPLFTVEAFDVEYKELSAADTSALLKEIVPTPSKPYFDLYYFSPYFNAWRTKQFYVGEGSLKIKTIKTGNEASQNISCSFVGRDKIC